MCVSVCTNKTKSISTHHGAVHHDEVLNKLVGFLSPVVEHFVASVLDPADQLLRFLAQLFQLVLHLIDGVLHDHFLFLFVHVRKRYIVSVSMHTHKKYSKQT